MGDAPGLADGLAVAVLAVGVFCASRFVLGLWWRRPSQRDVDLVHVVMGISMAGMLTGRLTAGPVAAVWAVTFVGATAWFGRALVRDLARPGAPGAGHLPHLVTSIAMLYMLLAMHWSVGSMAGMTRAAGALDAAGGPSPLALVVGLLIVAQATWAVTGRLARSTRVRAGTALAVGPARSPSSVSTVGPAHEAQMGRGAVAPIGMGRVRIAPIVAAPYERTALAWRRAKDNRAALAPRCTASCLLVMSVATAYMIAASHF